MVKKKKVVKKPKTNAEIMIDIQKEIVVQLKNILKELKRKT